jgi:hypothetical protein
MAAAIAAAAAAAAVRCRGIAVSRPSSKRQRRDGRWGRSYNLATDTHVYCVALRYMLIIVAAGLPHAVAAQFINRGKRGQGRIGYTLAALHP